MNFYDNELTMLDDDLFSANPNMQVVGFQNNKIKNIGLNTFKPLKNLKHLWLSGSYNCVNEEAYTRGQVETLISKLVVSCPSTNEMLFKENPNSQQSMEKIFESMEKKFEGFDNKLDSYKSQIKTTCETSAMNFETKFEALKSDLETKFEESEKKMETKLEALKNQIDYLIKKMENNY